MSARMATAAIAAVTVTASMALSPAAAADAGPLGGTASSRAHASAPVTSGARVVGAAARGDGPHSPVGRRPAPTTVTVGGGVAVADVDFGDADLTSVRNEFRAPVRGVLVYPVRRSTKPAPLVIVSHLRSPACPGGVFAFPCPAGRPGLRFDRGMEYLGRSLAAQGYAVLIPDVAPVLMGQSVRGDYDQNRAWQIVVGALRDRLVKAVAGSSDYGGGLRGAIDTRSAALIVHSRSGQVTLPAVRAWANGPTRITSVFGYGPFYTTPRVAQGWAPMVADVPFLAAVGARDDDVQRDGNTYLTQYLATARRSPASAVIVAGLGHNYINRALSGTHSDDRAGCESGCPGAAAHERFLTAAVRQWLSAVRGGRTAVPMKATDALPTTFGGLGARWLAVTNTSRRSSFDADGPAARVQAIGRGRGTVCRFYQPMDPTPYRDRCAQGETGTISSMSRLVDVRLGAGRGVRLSVPPTSRVRGVALSFALGDDRADRRKVTGLRVTLRDSRGRRYPVPVWVGSPSLTDRRTAAMNGTYSVTTLRLPTQRVAGLTRARITGIELTGDRAGGRILVRHADLVTG